MVARIDLVGRPFGRLIVVCEAPQRGKHRYWRCACECGNEAVVSQTGLCQGDTKSCGCLMREVAARVGRESATHGQTVGGKWSPTYRSYRAMIARIDYPSQKFWPLYGGRGIRVCDRWRNGAAGLSGYECFVADMGERPTRTTLDRIDGDGQYEPDNCRWATSTVQARNSKAVKLSEGSAAMIRSRYAGGESQVGIASSCGISQSTVSDVTRGRTWTAR